MDNLYTRELTEDENAKLRRLKEKLEHNLKYFSGYGPNTVFDYSPLFDFLKYSMNNIGAPKDGRNCRSSHEFEVEALDFFANLYEAPTDYHGYMTSGGSEANFYALFQSRELYPDAITYYSAHTHYSIPKSLYMLKMSQQVIKAQNNGEIDYEELTRALMQNKGKPAIVIANFGTTLTCAVDDVSKIKKAVKDAGVKHCFIHADAAFAGMVLPFVDDPQPYRFSDGIDSIAISGHKFIGTPSPCGLIIMRIHPEIHRPEYLKIVDTTLLGSRDGHQPLFLWYAIKRYGLEGFKKIINDGIAKINYARDLFCKNGIDAWYNKNSLMLVFPVVSERLLEKWDMPSSYGYCSITALPKLTYAMINELCRDMVNEKNGNWDNIEGNLWYE